MATSGSVNTTGYSGRYLTLSWSQVSQSIANNTTTISWTLKGAGGSSGIYYMAQNITVVINGATVYDFPSSSGQIKLFNGTVVKTGSATIVHDSTGEKTFTISVSAGIYNWSPNCSGSGTFELDRIARTSTLSTNDGVLGTELTLSIDRQNDSFTHSIMYKCGTASEYICQKAASTSLNWTPPLSLANQNTTGTTVSITFTTTTYSGDTSIGTSSTTITCSIPDSIVPSCSLSLERVAVIKERYTRTWWDNKPGYYQGLTKIKVDVTATEVYGSAITSCTTKIDDSVYNGTSFTADAPKKSGSVVITTTVKDKRGRTATASETITVNPCSSCQAINLIGLRCDQDGTLNDRGEYIWIQSAFNSGYCASNTDGFCKTTYYYKKTSSDEWVEMEDAALVNVSVWPHEDSDEKTNFIIQAETVSSYDIKMVVTDYFTSATITNRISTAFSLMHWNAQGNSIGIGKQVELENTLDIAMQTRHSGGLLPMVLESGTDLNSITVPNNYIGAASNGGISYVNSPTMLGFSLEVIAMNQEGAVKQRVTENNFNSTRMYERFSNTDASSWTSWNYITRVIDEGTNKVLDLECKTRHSGGLLPVVLESGTDLNSVITPNVYISSATSNGASYLNSPTTSDFSLEVLSTSMAGNVKQRIVEGKYDSPKIYERYSSTDASSWSSWTHITRIIEEGTSGIWKYRKWDNGDAECWGEYTGTSVAISRHLSGAYYSDAISIEYPFTFSQAPICTVSGGSDDRINWARKFADNRTTRVAVIVIALESQTTADISVNLHAFGKWK